MYTLLNNREASKYDLYRPGQLVASLHYHVTGHEILLVYCESIEVSDAEVHCRELMKRAYETSLNRQLTITVTCPIASRHLLAASPQEGTG